MREGFNWITIDFLTTFTGAVFVTNIITHFIKDYLSEALDKKILVLATATGIMMINLVIFDKVTLQNVYLAVVNSFLVATAAMGNYDLLTNKTKKGLLKEIERDSVKNKNTNIENGFIDEKNEKNVEE